MTKTKTKYLTADQLGILPEERKALIAFLVAPSYGRVVIVNGKAHYYDQETASDPSVAKKHECGTAGCVAGYVFAHARNVQGLKRLRGAAGAQSYIDKAFDQNTGGLLDHLYEEQHERTLKEARAVVERALRTGKVRWQKKHDSLSTPTDWWI